MRATSVAIAIAALFLGACGNNDIEVNKSRPISTPPSTPSTVLEAMSGKEEADQATDTAMDVAKEAMEETTDTASEMTKDTMDKAEEMAADAGDGADMMDKAKEMAEDSEVMDKAEAMAEDASDAEVMDKAKEMMADADMMDKAKEMAEDSDVIDSTKAMVDSDEMKEAMNDAHSMFGASGAEEVAEAAPVAMASVSMDDGKALANKSGCFACHAIDRKVLGPAWNDVAAKYASDKAAGKTHLLNKVAKGGKGVWADAGINAAMPPYSPRVSDENIEVLVDFILGL